ncbi:MAG: PadR family transcriptional regulator [Patescibacteria group bacterium]|jgi:DNA-binding PadR family transcriptional regulator
MNKEQLKGHSRMLILAALDQKAMHGYALAQALRDQMPDTFKFGMGMLYPLLHNLEKKGFITGTWREVSSGKRRVYELTTRGQKELKALKQDWAVFQKTITRIVHAAAI